MPATRFTATITNINGSTILRVPQEASSQLPSRGMVMVEGTINGEPFQALLEPDGKGSHWLNMHGLIKAADKPKSGDTVALVIEPSKEWPEPELPADVQAALAADSTAHDIWHAITPIARWDWLRWIRSTAQPETRKRRIEVMCSKMSDGKRRPCCFNRTECTDPSVSKSGVLIETASTPQ